LELDFFLVTNPHSDEPPALFSTPAVLDSATGGQNALHEAVDLRLPCLFGVSLNRIHRLEALLDDDEVFLGALDRRSYLVGCVAHQVDGFVKIAVRMDVDGEDTLAADLDRQARRPRLGLDTDHKTIPHEVGWIETAVHLSKGCYRGQETVARVANLGRPPRRLVRLHLDGSAREQLPTLESDISADGAVIGRLTSAAYHYELGPIALAVIKYATPDDVPVLVGTGEAAVSATLDPVVSRDTTPRPGQAARAAFRTLGIR